MEVPKDEIYLRDHGEQPCRVRLEPAVSWVTNVMLSVHGHDRHNAGDFAIWIRNNPFEYLKRDSWPTGLPDPWPEGDRWQGPYIGALEESPDEVWPGSKAPEAHVWLGVLNTADLSKVLARFAAIPWRIPNAVQLFLMDQEESYFRVWMIRDGRLVQLGTPPPDEDDAEFWPE